MFTGIIKKTGLVKKILTSNKGKRIGIKSNLKLTNKYVGHSVNCSGACLTLEKIHKGLFFFYLSSETLKKSNFKYLSINNLVNLETSLKLDDYISGHFVQGHIDTTSKLIKKEIRGRAWYLFFSLNPKYKKFLIYKGSIAINGISMTIAEVFKNSFLIVVIPHTLKLTNLKKIKKNDIVNVEIDILSKYMSKLK